MLLLFALIAAGLAAMIASHLAGPSSRLAVADHPNERSLHSTPVPRGGGIAILTAVFFTGFGYFLVSGAMGQALVVVAAGVFLLAVISYVDDRKGLSVRVRLPVHGAAAVLLLAGGVGPLNHFVLPAIIIYLLAFFAIVWMTNLYNFMDGMDGFAGGMTVIGFGFLAYFGWQQGAESFAVISLLVASASLGFLLFNLPPARLFLGDVGSIPLGFLAVSMALWGNRDAVFPIWVPVLVFSPFIVDATITLGQRLLRGEKFWQAHRCHYYQRLVRLGWGHRKTVMAEYLLMVAAGFSAVVMASLSTGWVIAGLVCWALIYFLLAVIVGSLEKKGGAA